MIREGGRGILRVLARLPKRDDNPFAVRAASGRSPHDATLLIDKLCLEASIQIDEPGLIGPGRESEGCDLDDQGLKDRWVTMDRLREHSFVLQDGNLVLRPMTEDDLDVIAPWNQDPEVLWFSEGDYVDHQTLDEIRQIYRRVGAHADMFVFELDGIAIGDGWVQDMNMKRILGAFRGRDCRRIDLQLAKEHWSHGIGTRAIRLLTAHAFSSGADLVFAVEVAAENTRSLGAFKNSGYVTWRRIRTPQAKHRINYDLICRPAVFHGAAPTQPHPGPDRIMAADEPGGAVIVAYRRSPDLEILLLHRTGAEHGADWAWTPPSGARFPAEPPDECAARELSEETGLELEPRRIHDCGTDHWWTYIVEVALDAPVELDDEHDAFEWVQASAAAFRCAPAVVSRSVACATSMIQRDVRDS